VGGGAITIVDAVAVTGANGTDGGADAAGAADGDAMAVVGVGVVAGVVAGARVAGAADVGAVAVIRGAISAGLVESFSTVITPATSRASTANAATPSSTGVHRWRRLTSGGVASHSSTPSTEAVGVSLNMGYLCGRSFGPILVSEFQVNLS
jgi:hypothetical protein